MRIGVLGVTRIACTCGARQAGSLPNRNRVKRATLFGSILISASAGEAGSVLLKGAVSLPLGTIREHLKYEPAHAHAV